MPGLFCTRLILDSLVVMAGKVPVVTLPAACYAMALERLVPAVHKINNGACDVTLFGIVSDHLIADVICDD